MERRELLGLLGATSAGILAMNFSEANAAEQKLIDNPHAECIRACQDCATKCADTCHHCMSKVSAGEKQYVKAMQLMADCEAFCRLSASMIARMSPLMVYSCLACADACRDCAKECGQFDSPRLKECAERCRSCEKSCRDMVKAMA